MHDYFDVLGVASDAPPSEIRRACARRIRKIHPDFHDAARAAGPAPDPGPPIDPPRPDAAIDFLDAAQFLDRIQRAFFGGDR